MLTGDNKESVPAKNELSLENDVEKTAQSFMDIFNNIKVEVQKVIVGYDEIIEQALIAFIAGGHVLLEGVPGLGKTLLVRTLADVVKQKFSRIQFTPDLMPADITGTNIVMEEESGRRYFEFQKGPVFGNIILADEINRATPRTQSALLEAMQEGTVTVAGKNYYLPKPFFVLATQNPIEMEGTYPLPEAQLDRFFFKLNVESPELSPLVEIFKRTTQAVETSVKSIIDGKEIVNMNQFARQVPIANALVDYTARIIQATAPESDESKKVVEVRKNVRYGASPRGGQAIILASKVRALVKGRLNVSADDIRAMSFPALRHRIILNFEGEAKGITRDEIINQILSNVPELKKELR